MEVFVGGARIRLKPAQAIGKGGEADVYDIGGGRALKVFKGPGHPDLALDPVAQEAARQRLAEHQAKLPAFPSGLPDRVVAPQEVARDGAGAVVGYTMPLLRGAEVLFRYGERGSRGTGIDNAAVLRLFRDLRRSVEAVHRAGVVIGDFNDLNVLVRGDAAHLIDADSFQFGPFLSRMFTERFVDPRLCDPTATHPLLVRPHDPDSDWYAFAAMFFLSLLFVEPYGGVYRPKDPRRRVLPGARPLQGISVFHPEVKVPRAAERWDVLPDDLLQHFHGVFERGRRGAFPRALLDALRFTRCTACGNEHARPVCPRCTGAIPALVREVVRVRGSVTSRRMAVTHGRILHAAVDGGTLRWLVAEDGTVKREGGHVVVNGRPDAAMRFRTIGATTLVGRGDSLVFLAPGRPPRREAIDVFGGRPMFEVNDGRAFWARDGRLERDTPLGPERIGDVLPGQTVFWVGSTFGFGFYRAGELHVAFVFDAHRGRLNDGVALPRIPGQLVDAGCVFSTDRAWFGTRTEEGGRVVHRCAVVRRDGGVEAVETEGEGSWMAHLRGACAAGPFLLVPTDDGILRVEVEGGRLVKTREFPDTEPFVDGGCRLLAAPDGVYVVDSSEVRHLILT